MITCSLNDDGKQELSSWKCDLNVGGWNFITDVSACKSGMSCKAPESGVALCQ